MSRYIIMLVITLLSTASFAETLKLKNGVVSYNVRSSDYNNYTYDSGVGKLNLVIEIDLVNGRLPNKTELNAVSEVVIKSQPKAHMMWVFFLLPKMESGSGAYATNHRVPKPEGIKIMEFMLYNTPYQSLIK